MLWHDEREKFNFAYLCKHDFVLKKFDVRAKYGFIFFDQSQNYHEA